MWPSLVWAMMLVGTGFVTRSPQQEPPVAPTPAPSEPDQAPEAPAALELAAGPTPDAPTVSLGEAVGIALTQNFSLLGAADAVSAARFRYGAAKAEFLPSLTPSYEKSETGSAYSLSGRQKVPWLGGSLTASTTLRTVDDVPLP